MFRLINLVIKSFFFRTRIFNLSINSFICEIFKVKMQRGCTVTEILFAEILFVWFEHDEMLLHTPLISNGLLSF